VDKTRWSLYSIGIEQSTYSEPSAVFPHWNLKTLAARFFTLQVGKWTKTSGESDQFRKGEGGERLSRRS